MSYFKILDFSLLRLKCVLYRMKSQWWLLFGPFCAHIFKSIKQTNKHIHSSVKVCVCVCVFPSWPSKQLTTFRLENSMHSISYANEVVGLFHEHYHTFYDHFALYLNISILGVFLALMSLLGEFPVTNYDSYSFHVSCIFFILLCQ